MLDYQESNTESSPNLRVQSKEVKKAIQKADISNDSSKSEKRVGRFE